ncbi:Microcystin-dependent protein [Methylomagnum ishizawai]|uniref:Microcystin-dependent protein n=1 Tax=Methylomagnum ishizawai TaxID=1760988 RepID=A0A1Y6D6W6_9GAMM|nr:tail fiber protein [Methylomagnum ishizawai]SMF96084.1 Microcystin-dependent protein [Methylomagnum ishizawai]
MDGYIGQITTFAGTFAPRNWHFCDGTVLPIQQYAALYSIIGTTYGGDGRSNFALPDLRGRTIVGAGSGPGLSPRVPGTKSGAETVTLSIAQIPAHTHALTAQANVSIPGTKASTSAGNQSSPAGNILSVPSDGGGLGVQPYAPTATANTTMGDSASATASFSNAPTTATGGGGSHDNMQPYLALNYIICLTGLYPARS